MKAIHYSLIISCVYGALLTGYIIGDKQLTWSLPTPAYVQAVDDTLFMDTEKLPEEK